jgi:hypothetical protein
MLTHVIPQECVPALQRLYERGVLEHAGDGLKATSFAYNLPLVRRDESKTAQASVVPRIHLNYLRDFLYKGLEQSFKPNLCEIMRDLYSSGLGVNHDNRLAAYWRAYSVYSQPVHNGITISQSDLLAVFKAHIEIAERNSMDNRYAYQLHVMNTLNVFHVSIIQRLLYLLTKAFKTWVLKKYQLLKCQKLVTLVILFTSVTETSMFCIVRSPSLVMLLCLSLDSV